MIADCRIMIVGTGEFISCVKEELRRLGFRMIADAGRSTEFDSGILVEFTGSGPAAVNVCGIPIIFPFDFINGAGAVVLFPGDDRGPLAAGNIRLRVAEYISGYCAFWNVEGCDWLHEALPAIRENKTSTAAIKTAAYMCAKIAANIAAGRDVKRFPGFNICRNLQ